MQNLVHNLEGDFMRKLKDHRSDQISIFQTGEEERQRLERMKLDRNESDNQYIKQMMQTIEKRLEDENMFRV